VVLLAVVQMKLVALLTDYGSSDHYVGVIKAVIKRTSPESEILDITHEVRAYDVKEGAFLLLQASRYLPRSCTVMAVVDPGVNTRRRAIAVETKERVYVGPDNGLLYPAASREGIVSIHEVGRGPHVLSGSGTFAGRDIFAPTAALVSSGRPLDKLGKRMSDMVVLELPEAGFTDRSILGMVLHVDRFGNAITNVEGDRFHHWRKKASTFWLVAGKRKVKASLVTSYQAIRGVGLLVGSGGTVEVSGREGRPAIALSSGESFSVEIE
jgi:S-adenosylmethionine hydrolase